MADSEFTSGPLRDLSAHELGVSGFSDFELLSDSGHNYVYRAMVDGKWVVLKVAKEEEGNTARNRLLLKREYDIMHAIDCLYVVKTWQMTEVPDLGTAIVIEYVAGRTLDRFVQKKPSLAERRRVADELMEALIFLHERQVVHGDLKPSNILITDAGNHVRLIDFGFADADAYMAKNIGTSPSIADPISEENDNLPIAKDIYALGKILELLFPRELRLVKRRCCAEKNRYSSVREVHAACRRYWRMTWLVPLLFAGLLALAALLWMPHAEEPMPQPMVDTAWQSVKEKAEKQYDTLYRVYADSITGMPEKTMNTAIILLSNYGNRMLAENSRLLQTYPQYEEPLQELYISCLTRYHLRLRNLCEDYPLIYSNQNGK